MPYLTGEDWGRVEVRYHNLRSLLLSSYLILNSFLKMIIGSYLTWVLCILILQMRSKWIWNTVKLKVLLQDNTMQTLSLLNRFSSVQSLSRVRLFATPWIAARQDSLSNVCVCVCVCVWISAPLTGEVSKENAKEGNIGYNQRYPLFWFWTRVKLD